jgi:TrmH family RNA methyltransferase
MDARIARFRSARRDPGLAVLEGFHALKHALRFRGLVTEAVSEDPGKLRRLAAALAPDIAEALARVVNSVPAGTLAAMVPEPNPPDVIAIATRPALVNVWSTGGTLILLERPTQLGNIGAVIRVAAAAGAAGVLTTGPADPWHPHALRGSAGLHFALPVQRVEPGDIGERAGPALIALHPEGEPLRAGSLPDSCLLAFGSERSGLSPGLLARASRRFAIPMRDGVSSLNLATAVAVALYLGRAGGEPTAA